MRKKFQKKRKENERPLHHIVDNRHLKGGKKVYNHNGKEFLKNLVIHICE